MKAVTWFGSKDIRVEDVPDAAIINPRDAIIRVTSTAICGSDLHLYNGYIPSMERGDILGHEFMGEVAEVGPEVRSIKVGDRVVVPFPIACGNCFFCKRQLWSLCDNTNPNAWMAEKLFGYSPSGIFGYSHLMGGYAGGQAEYVRVPFADVGCLRVDGALSDDQVLFLSDILPTAYMAAENCGIEPGDTVAVWGCGPVGQLAIRCAYLLGAERVIAIDDVPSRMRMARDRGNAEIIDLADGDVDARLRDMTGGRGPDACIEAVGMEAHGNHVHGAYDRAKQSLRLETGRAVALRDAIYSCRKGGTISIAGVYGGLIDKVPFGAAMNKALNIKMGQTHVHRYMRPLLDRITAGELDASFIVTHHMPLDDAPEAYTLFNDKEDECVKVVLHT